MRYSINIIKDKNNPVEYERPADSTVYDDLFAVGMIIKCTYDNLDSTEEKQKFVGGLKKFVNSSALTKKDCTIKS